VAPILYLVTNRGGRWWWCVGDLLTTSAFLSYWNMVWRLGSFGCFGESLSINKQRIHSFVCLFVATPKDQTKPNKKRVSSSSQFVPIISLL
jgi:hypothetical protein